MKYSHDNKKKERKKKNPTKEKYFVCEISLTCKVLECRSSFNDIFTCNETVLSGLQNKQINYARKQHHRNTQKR